MPRQGLPGDDEILTNPAETGEKKGCASRTPNPNRETSALGYQGPQGALFVARDHALNLERIMADTGGAEFDLNQNHATNREKEATSAGAGTASAR